MDEADILGWFKHGVWACFFTVPASLLASLLAMATGWYAWEWINAMLVGLVTMLVILLGHVMVAIWEWANS